LHWQQALGRLKKFCCAPFFFFLSDTDPAKHLLHAQYSATTVPPMDKIANYMIRSVFLLMRELAVACCKRDKHKNPCSKKDKQEGEYWQCPARRHRKAAGPTQASPT
jgi:hypothetical protein